MDLRQLKDRVFAILQDSNRLFVADEEVEAWLNDAQMDLVARVGETNLVETTGTDSTGTIAIPAGLLEIKRFELGGLPLTHLPSDEFEAWVDSGSTPGDPHIYGVYQVFGDSLEVYPTPDETLDYVIRYTKEPATLADEDDVPEVPAHLHMKLVYWARAQARWKEGEAGLGDRDMSFYMEGLPPSPVGMARHRPRPISMRPDLGTWVDRDIEASHL